MPTTIRGFVFAKYDSISAFAKAMKWGRQKASRIVKGDQRPTADEMEQMADDLGIVGVTDFIAVFFPHYATK